MNKFTRKIASIITAAAMAFSAVALPDIGVFPSLVVPASATSPWGTSGEGTASSPYLISNSQQWSTFALYINTENSTYGDKYYKLTADITVDTNDTSMIFVGNSPNPFRGHFDGGSHTLTFNYSGIADGAAPFRYVNGATIKNLKVVGSVTINGGSDYAAGIAGYVTGNTTISNCTSSVTISPNSSDSGRFGGLVGSVASGVTLNINNCVFNGSMTGSSTFGNGGFVGYNLGTVNITDCLLDPGSIGVVMYSFVQDRSNGISSLTRAYRTYDFSEFFDQGIRVYTDAPANAFSKKVKIFTNDYYWQPGTAAITGIEATYPLSGTMALPTCGVTFDSTALSSGTDYTVTVKNSSSQNVNEITAADTYTLTVTGKENYAGSISKSFIVYTGDSVPYVEANGTLRSAAAAQQITSSTTSLTAGFWYVNGDVNVSDRINTTGNVSIILCDGATLTAQKGIGVTNGNSLTIYAQSGGTGTLNATGEDENAGIGGERIALKTPTYGNITINGGIINAVGGGKGGAGIGGASRANANETGGIITINGGTITATGTKGAGIGGGREEESSQNTFSGTIIINGGNITAIASCNSSTNAAANIGGGYCGSATITINGGVVNAGNSTDLYQHGIGNGYGGSGSAISLKWTNGTDRITAKDYSGTVTLDNSKLFVLENTNTQATTSNISGKTLVPAKTVTIADTTRGTVALPGNVPSGSYFGIGSKVILTVTPDDGLTTENVKYGSTEITPVDGVYSFDMPENDVTVSAEFGIIVTWLNDDGTELETNVVEYGTTPSYTGSTPTKVSDEYFSYTFDHWTPEVASATEAATYTAVYAKAPLNDDHFSQSGNTYTIKDAAGWYIFCELVNYGNTFSGKTVKFADGFDNSTTPVTAMAGTSDNKFCGTFDGNGKTLTVGYGSSGSPFDTDYCAPFRFVGGATIKNLRVTGDIYSANKFASGLVGQVASGSNTIDNCRSSVIVHSSVIGDGTHGGFIGNRSSGDITIKGCVFDGKLLGTLTTSCGGFVGWNGNTPTSLSIINSIYAPADDSSKVSNVSSYTFARNDATITNSYYTLALGTAQGKARFGSITAGEGVTISAVKPIGSASATYNVSGITAYNKGVVYNGEYYYGAGDEVSLKLDYTGSSSSGYKVTAGTLTGTDNPYTLKLPIGIDEVTVYVGEQAAVTYIDADGKTKSVTEYQILSGGGATTLYSGWYVVDDTVQYTGKITVSGDVHIILKNGATMKLGTANSPLDGVFRSENGSLTIYGQSLNDDEAGKIIAYSSSQGIYRVPYTQNGGNVSLTSTNNEAVSNSNSSFTLNGGKLTIQAASGERSIGGKQIVINGGVLNAPNNKIGNDNGATITLDWTNGTDSITAGSYAGTVTIAEGKAFWNGSEILKGSVTDLSKINGKTLTPANIFVTASENGTVTSNKNYAAKDTNVTLTVTPADGYQLASLTVMHGDIPVTVTDNTFTMPAGNVTVSAVFEKIPATTPTITTQPSDLELTYGYTTGNVLTVAADSIDDHTLSYQWYSNTGASNEGGTEINGATSASYTVLTGKNAGTTEYYYCVVTATRDNGETATATSNAATVSVGKATPSITTAPTASGITYGQTLGDSTLSGGAASVAGSFAWTNGTVMPAVSDSGTTEYDVTFTPSDTTNYNTATCKVKLTVSKASAQELTDANKPTANTLTYNGDDQALVTAPTTPIVGYTLKYSLDGTNWSETIPTGKNAMDYTVKAKYFGGDNSEDSAVVDISVTIAQKPITITAKAQTVEVGGIIATGTDKVSISSGSLADGDTITTVTLTGDTSSITDSGTVTISSVTIEDASGNDVTSNYDITYTAGTLTVTKKQITVSGITAKNKIYDGTTDAELDYSAVVLTGAASGAKLSVTATGTFADKNVGTGKTVTISGITLTGDDADNYALAEVQQTTATANITAKAVTITGLGATNKEYDGTTTATVTGTAAIDGKVGSDDVSVSAGTASFADANVGTVITVTFSGYSLSGTAAGNYTLSEQPASVTASITQKEVTVSGITASNKTYDGTTDAQLDYSGATIMGKIEADDLTVTATGAFEDANAGTDKTVTISGLTLGGADAGNYVLAENGQQTSTTADITPTTYTVTYKVVNGTWADDTTADKTETVTSGANPSNVPTGMKASSGYTGGAWDTDPTTVTITGATTFTYTFTAVPTYAVTVNNGTGGGSYAQGASVTITAGAAPSGQQFKEWTGADGLTFTSGSATTSTATFTMPANAVEVTATYEDIPATSYAVTITAGTNMTTSGAANQTVTAGSAITNVVYTANYGYYFPTTYSVAAVNGISVTRDSYTQITVSGTPTAAASITLTAATAKTKPATPTTPSVTDCTTAGNNDGTITGITADMEYKKSDAAGWTAGTGSVITGLSNGTYYVRIKATDTTIASDNQVLTIAAYTASGQVAAPTFNPAAGSYIGTKSVTISCATAGATIHYTTDGTDPTAESAVYTTPISVSTTTTIKAMAVKDEMDNSSVSTAIYTINPATYTLSVTAPTFDAVSVGYAQPAAKAITITSTGNSNATISSVELSGTNADSFTLTNGTASVTAGGTNTNYTIRPNAGLAAGTYTATITVTYNGEATATANVSFTVNALDVVATPTFSPVGGEYTEAQNVTISCTTSGATIYYTTNGSTPTTSSTKYTSAISVSATTTIKAIAVKSGMTNSSVASATYTITPAETVATPTFSPAGGTFTSAQSVTISCATSDATIYYTTDGTTPTTSSAIYSSAISVSATTTIKAIAVKAGMTNSTVASATYTISSVHVHSYTSAVTTEPTCTTTGLRTYTCSGCGDSYTEVIPLAAHKYTAVRENEVAPDCIHAGSYDEVEKCSVCGNIKSRTTKTVPALGHDFKDGKCTRCGAVEVTSGNLQDVIDNTTGDSVILALDSDTDVSTLKFPKNVKEITIDGGGHTLDFTGAASIKPNQKLTLANITIKAEKNGKKQNITLTAAAGGLVLENVTFDGKKTTITATKGDLTLDNVTASDLTVKGASKRTLTVEGNVNAATFSGFGSVKANGALTVTKTLKVNTLDLSENAVLNVVKGATITLSKGISGNGTINLASGFKAITINGKATGNIKLTGDKMTDGQLMFKSKLTNLNDVFDVSGIAPAVIDGEYSYGLYAKSGKVYLRAFKMQVGDKTYCELSDVLNGINKSKEKGKSYELDLLGDIDFGKSFKLPTKGKYNSLSIDGNGHSISFKGTTLTLTGNLTLKNVKITAMKNGKPVAWTIKKKQYELVTENAELENCKVK